MINNILELFNIKEVTYHIDNFKQYEYVAVTSPPYINISLTEELYRSLNEYITSYDYKWSFEIDEINYTINQNSFCILEIDDDQLEELDNLRISLKIFKEGRRTIIFNEYIFFKNLNEIGLKNILLNFQKIQKPILIENTNFKGSIGTNIIGYNSEVSDIINNDISLQCLFYNFSELNFTPENFSFDNDENTDYFTLVIKKIYFIYLLIYLFDVSEIREKSIFLQLKGHKTYDFNLNFDDIRISSINEYKKIYEWVYSEKGKIEDKLGIARNIIGFYIKKDSLKIDNKAFSSILSANQLYIKENLTKYLDARTKIYEQVEQITNKINSSLDIFFGNFQKSVFAYITFYLTVFIYKIFNKSEISTAINKEATLVGIGLLILSLFFMGFSLVILFFDKKRIKEKYSLIKIRFEDILNKEDVNKILNDDKEFEDDIKFFKKRKNTYLLIWCITILILLSILFSTSSYINFKYLLM